jgi:hypothetical protein
MIKNNLLGQILIGLLVFFLLLSSIQMFGWGQGIDPVVVDTENKMQLPVLPKITKQDVVKKDDKQLMDSIIKRPVFSLTRTPFVAPEDLADTEDPVLDEVHELNAQLTGVVITPQGSYAMIMDGVTNKKETYKVGMPLSGEQGGWTLNSIQSRKVVFVSDDDKTAELELDVFTGTLKAGGKTDKKQTQTAIQKNINNDSQQSRKDKKKNADDIRKKIAERRAQMRADAAKKNNNK